jgi:formamidopyrimidine-DNA glycosylase
MPELPEVETIRRTLAEQVIGKTIIKVEVTCDRIIQRICPTEFQEKLVGETIRKMDRFGKYLFFVMDNFTLISHLRMEGKYYVLPSMDPVGKYEHVKFSFSDGSSLRYEDMRKFGTMELVLPGAERNAKGLCEMGLEPFDEGFTIAYLKSKIQKSHSPIKSLLLDQKNVVGLGNIYVNEVLFQSQIHPETKASALHDADYAQLIINTRFVLRDAIEFGGTTIRSYYSGLGISGNFQDRLCVHGKKGEPCSRCGTLIEKMMVGGRGTYFCPHCQKKEG